VKTLTDPDTTIIERLRINAASWRRDDCHEARDEGEAELNDEAADAIAALHLQLEEARKVIEPFALMSSEGLVTAESGHVRVVTCAEYFHRARAFIKGEQS
jgi:hypothetical protein